MSLLADLEAELLSVFRRASDKHEANRSARPILEQAAREPRVMTEAFSRYVGQPGSLDRGNYPTVGVPVWQNAHFSAALNCWIPLPDRRTNLSTKAIHHHGDMLLSTVTLWGSGYEHWTFSPPRRVDAADDVWTMELLERAPHGRHHVAFVDHHVAHTPFFTKDVSVTLALWSDRFPTSWRDRAKRLPLFRGREENLRRLAVRLGLKRQLNLKVVEYFDFYPGAGGFIGMKIRKEFEHGPNDDHVASVFAVLAATENRALGREVRKAISSGKVTAGRQRCEELLPHLERGREIQGRLSPFHYELPYANFPAEDILRSLGLPAGVDHAVTPEARA